MLNIIGARAVVTLTVEVTLQEQAWGDECTLTQIHKQAIEAAVGKTKNLLSGGLGSPAWIRLTGEPTVQTVIVSTRKV